MDADVILSALATRLAGSPSPLVLSLFGIDLGFRDLDQRSQRLVERLQAERDG
jgi:hypothetical protein